MIMSLQKSMLKNTVDAVNKTNHKISPLYSNITASKATRGLGVGVI